MIRNKRNGFTLVELLAVIVILAVILVIAVPQIMGVIDSARIGSLESTAKLIAAGAETWYQTESLLSEEEMVIPECSEVAQINNEDYENCEIEFVDGRAYVTIAGAGKFLGKYINGASKTVAEVSDAPFEPTVATTHISNLLTNKASENGLYIDPTVDTNIRYTGLDPKNYVTFNNELWRIIGVFNVSNGSTTSNRVKLIRDESIGDYSWDSNDSAVDEGKGVNNWVESDLNLLLNDYYYNGKDNQTCYINRYAEQTDSQTNCSFGDIGIKNTTADSLIENVIWTLGGNNWNNPSDPPYGLPTLTQYNTEKGSAVYTVGTPTTHTAKIGLLFPSDYGYASTDEDCRNNLRSGVTYVDSTLNFDEAECKNDNWLHTRHSYWTISPYTDSAHRVFSVRGGGAINNSGAYNAIGIRPAIYLKSDVEIVRGTGSEENPYELSLN